MSKTPTPYAYLPLYEDNEDNRPTHSLEVLSFDDDHAWFFMESVFPRYAHIASYYIPHSTLRYLCRKLALAYGYKISNAEEIHNKYNK